MNEEIVQSCSFNATYFYAPIGAVLFLFFVRKYKLSQVGMKFLKPYLELCIAKSKTELALTGVMKDALKDIAQIKDVNTSNAQTMTDKIEQYREEMSVLLCSLSENQAKHIRDIALDLENKSNSIMHNIITALNESHMTTDERFTEIDSAVDSMRNEIDGLQIMFHNFLRQNEHKVEFTSEQKPSSWTISEDDPMFKNPSLNINTSNFEVTGEEAKSTNYFQSEETLTNQICGDDQKPERRNSKETLDQVSGDNPQMKRASSNEILADKVSGDNHQKSKEMLKDQIVGDNQKLNRTGSIETLTDDFYKNSEKLQRATLKGNIYGNNHELKKTISREMLTDTICGNKLKPDGKPSKEILETLTGEDYYLLYSQRCAPQEKAPMEGLFHGDKSSGITLADLLDSNNIYIQVSKCPSTSSQTSDQDIRD